MKVFISVVYLNFMSVNVKMILRFLIDPQNNYIANWRKNIAKNIRMYTKPDNLAADLTVLTVFFCKATSET